MIPWRASTLLLLVVSGCAQVRDPSGGDKDSIAPQLLEAEPPSGTTGFQGDRIILRFDERVKVAGSDKVLVSPPLTSRPDVRMLGSNAVMVELKSPLEPNTTYVFNIGDAVTDLTEGNVATGLLYVLSTGDHIDSLQVQGEVLNAATALLEKDVLVMLYDLSNDTGFTAGRPSYYTRTLENGSYHLRYLRPGKYAIRALRDQNGNYRYDLPNEEVAFLPGTIEAHLNDTLGHVLRLFREPGKEQLLISAKSLADAPLRLVFARPAGEVTLQPVDWTGGDLRWNTVTNETRDTVLCWPSDTTLLQGRSFRVTVDGQPLDTIQYVRREKMPFNVLLHLEKRERLEGTSFSLIATRPVEKLEPERASLRSATAGLPTPVLLPDSLDARRIHLVLPKDLPSDAALVLLPKTIQDIYGGTNDTLRFAIGGPASEELGQLTITMQRPNEAGGSILQVLTSQDLVVREVPVGNGSNAVGPLALPPGTYALRLVDDPNGNGRWDTGDLATGLLPEQVQRYSGPITVRAGWEVGINWEVGPH